MALLIEKNLIDGQWIDAGDGKTIDVHNPANGDLIGKVPHMNAAKTEKAIQAAFKAQKDWAGKTAYERAKILQKWAALIWDNLEELAQIITRECGKPIAEARTEATPTNIEWNAEEAKRIYGRTIPANVDGRDILTIQQPVGVCGMITPWNFPMAMITRKVVPALAAGCTVVLKPDHRTPFSALALGKLAQEAGLPDGVLNIVTGDAAEIGKVLTTHALVRKISFTGSTPVGKSLMQQAASTVKKISLELGGNAPFIVFDKTDMDVALAALLQGKIRNSGQTCVCPNRIYLHEAIHDAFVEKLVAAVGKLKTGDGFDADVKVGPLIDEKGLAKVERLITSARDAGAKVLLGGKRHALGGTFYEPTIITGVTAEMEISREEIFGPVFAIQKFSSEEDVVRLANDTVYGLVSYVCSNDLPQVQRVMRALEYGMVGVNTGLVSFAGAPFGGMKESGLGREGGIEGIGEYLETKYIALQG